MDVENFGRFIKNLRTEKKFTLKDLSEKIGYSEAYISMVENGKKQNPSHEFLLELSKGLEVRHTILMNAAGYEIPMSIGQEEYLKELLYFQNLSELEKTKQEMKDSDLGYKKLDEFHLEERRKRLEDHIEKHEGTLEPGELDNRNYELPMYIFNLHYLLSNDNLKIYYDNKNISVSDNKASLSAEDKANIIKFIETFINKKRKD